MVCVDFFSIMKNIALTISSLTAAYVAYSGLNTWKKRLTGQDDYDLARRILVSLYQYRDAIDWVRHPFISVREMENDGETINPIDPIGTTRAYERRWKRLIEVRSVLDSCVLEAEAIWESTLKNLMKEINDLQFELYFAIEDQISFKDPKEDNEHKKTLMKNSKTRRKILYKRKNGDEYDKKLRNHIQEIESYLKPKLKLKD